MPHHLPEDQKIEIEPAPSLVYTPMTLLFYNSSQGISYASCGGGVFNIGEPSQPFTSTYKNEPVKFGHGNDGTPGKHFFRGNGDNICSNCGKWISYSSDPANAFCNPADVEVIRAKIHAQDNNLQLCDY